MSSVYIRVITVYAENGTNISTRSWIRKFPSVFLIAFWKRWEGRKEGAAWDHWNEPQSYGFG